MARRLDTSDGDYGFASGGDRGPRADIRLRDLLLRNVALYRDEPAVTFGDDSISWREYADRVFRLANRLAHDGVGRGSRIAVIQRNGPEIAEIYFAAALCGAVAVPVTPRSTADEVTYVVRQAGVERAFVEDGHPAGEAVAAVVPCVSTRHAEYGTYRDEGAPDEPVEREEPGDPVLQMYTSGTTGRPKGAVVSQRAMVQHGLTVQVSQGLTHDDVFLSATPLTHAATGTRVFCLAIDGMQHVILEAYTVEAFSQAVERHGVTTTVLVPTMLRSLLQSESFDPSRLKSLRYVVYGAAPSTAELVHEALERLPCGLLHGYGLTEGGPALTALGPEEHERFLADPSLHHRLASVGRPVPGVRFRVVDDAGGDVATGEVGELLVRSTKVMDGYWARPEETEAAFLGDWLATGDVGYVDEQGYVFVVDRKKDVVISGGLNVYPSELERVLSEDTAVQEAAVIGVPDPKWGEVPVAFVAPLQDAAAVDRLRASCREQLAGYKQPSRILTTDALPRTETGKVHKGTLREWAASDDGGPVPLT